MPNLFVRRNRAFLFGAALVLLSATLAFGQGDEGEPLVFGDEVDSEASATEEGGDEEEIETLPEPEINVMTLDPAGSPIFGPGAGAYAVGTEVNIMTLQRDAKVHFTTDGSIPTNYSIVFTEPFVMSAIGEFTLKAVCSAPGYRDSDVITMEYRALVSAQPPSITGKPLEGQPCNTSEATESFLGVYQDAVKIHFESATTASTFYYTIDGTEPTLDSHYTRDSHILISAVGTHTVRVKAKSDNTFLSEETEITVTVIPRPPREAFHLRSDKELLADMDVAYQKMADKHIDEVMRPEDLDGFIAATLNPDMGRCELCKVRPSEAEQLIEATEVLKYDEGLHIDGQLKLFHGFVTRGSMFTFIRKLNVKMNDQRKRLQALADDARTAEM
jgi:hypothetical protein|eukprot:g4986.t1